MNLIERKNPDDTIVEFWCDPTAKIDDRAKIGANAKIDAYARIGAYANIGAGAIIGAYANIGAGAIIGVGAKIGADANIGAYAKIGAGAKIGANANIDVYARIGVEANIKRDEYLNGQTESYYWDLYKIGEEYQFRYGCELHPLKYWTLRNIKALCAKHNDFKQLKAIQRIVATCKAFTKGL